MHVGLYDTVLPVLISFPVSICIILQSFNYKLQNWGRGLGLQLTLHIYYQNV